MSCSISRTVIPRIADRPDQGGQAELLGRIHARGRLVQEEQFRAGSKSPGNLQPALIAVRQVARRLLFDPAYSHQVQQVPGELHSFALFPTVTGQTEKGAGYTGAMPGVGAHHDVLERRHLGEEADVLKGPGHSEPGDLVGFLLPQYVPGEAHHPFGWMVNAGDDIKGGRLPRAVGADQPEDLSLPDGEVELRDCHHTTEADADPLELEQYRSLLSGGRMSPFGGHLAGTDGIARYLAH